MKKFLLLPLLFCVVGVAVAQQSDSIIIRNIYSQALLYGKAYAKLEQLTLIGPRLSGSTGADKAVAWAKAEMVKENFGTVSLQEVMVPHWVRNDIEKLNVVSNGKKTPLRICSLGGSIPTPAKGIKASVIEVKSFEDLERHGADKIKGKIVFFMFQCDNIITIQWMRMVKQESLGIQEL